jgi:HSP20 family molecular chaperone IbpA
MLPPSMYEQGDVQVVPVKIYQTDHRLVVAAPMPGLMPQDVLVVVTWDGQLLLSGNRRGTLKGDKNVLVNEWDVGIYRRHIALPVHVAGDLATVTYGNGVLVVVLPLARRTTGAILALEPAQPGHGERVGSAGRPVKARSSAEFRLAREHLIADHGGPAR